MKHIRVTAVLAALAATAVLTSSAASAETRSAGPACDQACQAAWQQQNADALPRTSFYQAPDPLPQKPAGTLIRQQTTSVYQVGQQAVTATRILYHSRTSAGHDVAVSGVVLVPPGPPPSDGWPVVVDAHGTSGIARDCAPSLMRDLYHGNQMLQFISKGWAVVAPDYAGMGTNGRVEFVNATAEANDLLDGLLAARQAGLGLASWWVLWGHSQGGGAALAVAQRLASQPDASYLGAVITSPAADLVAAVSRLAQIPYVGGGFVALLAGGTPTSDPHIHPRDVLSPEALKQLPITSVGCLGVVSAAYEGLSGLSLVQQGYLDGTPLARYLSANSTGSTAVAGPVLLLQGDADVVIPPAQTEKVASALCASGVAVDYRTYPGLGHDTIPGQVTGIDDGAMSGILAWVTARFAAQPARSTCP